jgi:hypothetical protein
LLPVSGVLRPIVSTATHLSRDTLPLTLRVTTTGSNSDV